ncbi:MAG: YncE family protein [Anaerolineae bacterium]
MARLRSWFVLLAFLATCCSPLPGAAPSEAATSLPPAPGPGALPSSPSPAGPAGPLRCPDPEPPLVTDLQVRQPPPLAEPVPRAPFRDPAFGRCLVRVTDRLHDKSAPGGLKNEYSRVQAFNADETRILARSTEGTWHLYDAQALQPLGELPLGIDPRWSATDPHLIYFSEETRLVSYNVATGEVAVVHEFAGDFPGQDLAAVWTRYEGSPSRDGRTWALMAEDQDWLTTALLVYDLTADQVVATLDTRGWPAEAREIDGITISPLGTYVLVNMDLYCEPGTLGTPENPCGLMVYDRALQDGRGLLRIVGHCDTALDAQGREVLVYQDIDTDFISMLDLATGAITPLWPIDFSHTSIGLHVSGRALNRPGWVVISTHDGDVASHTWMDDSVFLLELRPNGRVVRLAHTHSLVDERQEHDYWAEPHATANRDLTRVLFTSNWGRSGTDQVEMYLVFVPPEAFSEARSSVYLPWGMKSHP